MKTHPETGDEKSKIKFEGFEFKPNQMYFSATHPTKETHYYTYDELVKENIFTPDPKDPLTITETGRSGKRQRDLRQECEYISDPVLIELYQKIRKIFFAVRNTNTIEGRNIYTEINGLKILISFHGTASGTTNQFFQVYVEDPVNHLKVHRSCDIQEQSRINAFVPNYWVNDKLQVQEPAINTVPQEFYAKLEKNLNLKEILKIIEQQLNTEASKLPQEKVNEIRKKMGLGAN